jgi:predicted MPP superfamily phosphohydrolase
MLAYVGLIAAGSAGLAYGNTGERHWTEVTRTRLRLDLGPDGPTSLRIALLTDFHYDPLEEGDYFARIVAATNAQHPDLVLLLGDFVTRRAEPGDDLIAILAGLKAPLGVRAVLGNHDAWCGPARIRRALERHGIDDLSNRIRRVSAADGTLTLAGLDSMWGGSPDPRILRTLRREERVLLAHHEPDGIDDLPAEWQDHVALQVSGHTHGGQICAPGGIVLRRVSHGRNYTRGLYAVTPRTRLYVSRGLGTVGVHARLFCRPEIAVLDLAHSVRAPA